VSNDECWLKVGDWVRAKDAPIHPFHRVTRVWSYNWNGAVEWYFDSVLPDGTPGCQSMPVDYVKVVGAPPLV